jgi:hypothetical protein
MELKEVVKVDNELGLSFFSTESDCDVWFWLDKQVFTSSLSHTAATVPYNFWKAVWDDMTPSWEKNISALRYI